jgi:ribonuclease HI
MKAILNCDGGSRGNPGPAASGAVLFDLNEQIIDKRGKYLGIQTNNIAEYTAVIIGIEMALENGVEELRIRLDSELIVKQMNGIYKVKHPALQVKYNEIQALLKKLKSYSFEHVYREKNKDADRMVNKVLDAEKARI